MESMNPISILFFLFFTLASMVPLTFAHIGNFDQVWQKRAEDAWKVAQEAYHPDPEDVNDHLNHHVRIALEGTNSTRRSLRINKGPCLATNPIDRCWRCKNWWKNRKTLARCALGFGRKTTGGLRGKYYIVTDSSDGDLINPKPGTLRHAVIQKGPLWIIFAHSMIIRLSQELIMTGDKTIDGRGVNVHIAGGAGLMIQYVNNVIIHGLHFHNIVAGGGGMIRDSVDHYGLRTESDGDAISVFGSTNIWIDHNSLSLCKDGLVDVVQGSTAITISNNHMTHHDDVMLLGSTDSYHNDTIMQVTVAFNHFGRGLVQRLPRVRFGFVHVVNNDYTHWLMYAIGGSQNPTIICQGNRFIAPPIQDAKEVTKREYTPEEVWKHWTWRSEGDLLMNGATFRQSGNPSKNRGFSKKDMITAKSGKFVTRLTRFAGALNCRRGIQC